MMKIPSAPTGLKAPGKKFWQKILSEFELTDYHDLKRLEAAASCVDEIAECQVIVQSEGRFIKDRFKQIKEHPAARAIRDSKTLFCRIVRELNLDVAPPDSRPPARY